MTVRFEFDNMLLWYGTPDASAPTGVIPLSGGQARVTINVAVQPPSPSNTVQIIYRVNGGAPTTVSAVMQRQDLLQKVQYFSAQLPPFHAGDAIDYVAVARSPGRQVPSPAESSVFSSSFSVALPAGSGASGTPSQSSPGHSSQAKSSLTKTQLLSLYSLRLSTLAEVQTHDKALATILLTKVATHEREMVNAAFVGASPALLAALAKIDLTSAARGTTPLRQVLVNGFKTQKLDPKTAHEATERMDRLERSGRLVDASDASTPVERNPLLAEDVSDAVIAKLTDNIHLNETKTKALLAAVDVPEHIDDSVLSTLVGQKILTTDEATAIGLLLILYRLTSGSVELAVAAKGKVATFAGILKLSIADWQQLITSSHAAPPPGLDVANYAAALRRAATELHPTGSLEALSATASAGAVEQALSTTAPLASKNAQVFGSSFENLDTSGTPEPAVASMRTAHALLSQLANQHPGLGLAAVLNSNASSPDKAATVAARIAAVQRLQELNPNTEFLGLDYRKGSGDLHALKTDGISPENLHFALENFKAAQRVHVLAGNVDHTHTLLSAGFSSATSVASEKYSGFLAKSGLSEAAASALYQKAKEVLTHAAHAAMSAISTHVDIFSHLNVGNALPSVKDYLKEIPGFSELFGSQDYCNCTECQSIIGAPAYFVDLMSFIEHNVLSEVFTGAKQHDLLHLKVRRPDLWTLPLTCNNTNTLIPYLDVINEVLENFIATRRGFKGKLSDRGLLETTVYQEAIAKSHSSFRQPFDLPLLKLDVYLGHFSSSRLQIARALLAPDPVVVKAALKVSHDVYQLLVTPKADLNSLKSFYGSGLTEQHSTLLQKVGSGEVMISVPDLLAATGYTRSEVAQAIVTNFVSDFGKEKIHIQAEKSSPSSVQNDIEHIRGLTLDALDRLHRFTRLLRATGWQVPELDLVLSQLISEGTATGISSATLSRITEIQSLDTRWSLPIDQNCALWSAIPTVALDPTQGSLFDRLFNFAPFVLLDGALPKPTVSFVHSSFRAAGTPLPPDNTGHRLLAGLQVSDDDLAALIVNLAPLLGAKPDAPSEADRGFLLTAPNLGLLYRHALAARELGVPIGDLFQMIQLAGLSHGSIETLDDLLTLTTFSDWYQTSGYSLDDLGLITGAPVRKTSAYPDKSAAAALLASGIIKDHALEFANTVFAFLPGVTETQSKQVVDANGNLFESVLNAATPALRLTTAFKAGVAITIPAGVPLAPTDAIQALAKYSVAQAITTRLANILNIDPSLVSILVGMTGTDLSADAMVKAVEGGPPDPLVSLVGELIPLKTLFSQNGFDSAGLTFIAQNPSIFGISSFAALNLSHVKKLSVYATTAANLADANPLRASLAAFQPAQGFKSADPKLLSLALSIDSNVLATLLPNVTLPSTAPEAFQALRGVAARALGLGVGGDTLAMTLSDDYSQQARANQAILSALRAKYPNQSDFLAQLKPLDDTVRSAKRDALVDYILRSMGLPFKTKDDLYNYFLLDVQLEGCAETSKVVAAISSAQLYVYRCLMNLEEDQRSPSDPAHIHVSPQSIPGDEWSWRKNYRVWQANRKVFLFPESYIEPGLRDDKTPLFEDLESTLLQQPINEQNVLDAYSDYLNGFDQLSKMQIAGSYQDIDASHETDRLHLFGVTSDDPPQYFYRTIENAIYGEKSPHKSTVYGPWRPVSVQIPVREVSPVVYLGRLFVFWTEVKTSSVNAISNGNSNFAGYKHHLVLKYTQLRLDGNWTPPQALTLADKTLFPAGEGVVSDPLGNPLPWESDLQKLKSHVSGNIFDAINEAIALGSIALEIAQTPRYDTVVHTDAKDGYTLAGFQWERVYPRSGADLVVVGHNFSMRASVDFYNKDIRQLGHIVRSSPVPAVLCGRVTGSRMDLFTGVQNQFLLEDYAWCSVVADDRRIERLTETFETQSLVSSMKRGLYKTRLATMSASAIIDIINNSVGDALLDVDGDVFLLQSSVHAEEPLLRRLSTTLGERLCRTLFVEGVEGLLDINTQMSLAEKAPPLTVVSRIQEAVVSGQLDFKGSLGTYFREIFFHAPFLIADQLNSQQNYPAAQNWYHYIFDPTVDDIVPTKGTSAAHAAQMERDRVWRYLEFRGLDVPKLRAILTDAAAIEAYKKDPFNPHAIARLRLSAYQKCIVMKYIDNLIDWGDSLFREFTMESVNEATLLYVTALEILGPRPEQIGDCGQTAEETRTYASMATLLQKGSDFLVELETYTPVPTVFPKFVPKTAPSHTFTISHSQIAHHVVAAVASHQPVVGHAPAAHAVAAHAATAARESTHAAASASAQAHAASAAAGVHTGAGAHAAHASPAGHAVAPAHPPAGMAHAFAWKSTYAANWASRNGRMETVRANTTAAKAPAGVYCEFPHGIVRQVSPVFCIPPNTDFFGYWDRVEGQLYKIRHCMDINGTVRQLALFAPPIDPRLLVEAAAEGLSLDDVLNSISGDLPPYRFTYLIERAKQYATQVQSFGSMLLSAIEKRDAEQLNMMRLTQQQNILTMTTKMRQFDIDMANNSIDALNAQQATVQYRHDYYQGLVDGGLNAWEATQAATKHAATAMYIISALLSGTGGVLHLIPQLGSPFAMKYGGVELGHSAKMWSQLLRDTANLCELISASAGLQAGFDRRSEGWQHQVDLAAKELAQIGKQIAGANIRLSVAERAMDIHQKTIDQLQTVYEFSKNRFSNLGLYTWLATTMQRLYRDAYNGAYAMAKLAEQAYRFERNDKTTVLLSDNYWNSQHSGLLAGESLLADLSDMERRFIETNYRRLEIDQSFPLSQVTPAALVSLRESGSCDFSIDELFFDLFYPGQYCRQIKAVRLTLPCVTGPFTNVGATLTLTGSKLRLTPQLGAANLVDVPLQRTVAIATSTAQNDSGVFEFSFRDERYMPFEGAGAVSSWKIELPSAFRPFDYQSITDAVVHISYTASHDGLLRENVEKQNAALEGAILQVLKNQPLARLFSFRQEFSTAFNRILHSAANTSVKFTISDRHLPIFLRGRNLRVSKAELLLRTPSGQTVENLNIAVDGMSLTAFSPDPNMGNLLSCDLSAAFVTGFTGDHTIAIVNAGNLAPKTLVPGDLSVVDEAKLLDVLVYIEYQLA